MASLCSAIVTRVRARLPAVHILSNCSNFIQPRNCFLIHREFIHKTQCRVSVLAPSIRGRLTAGSFSRQFSSTAVAIQVAEIGATVEQMAPTALARNTHLQPTLAESSHRKYCDELEEDISPITKEDTPAADQNVSSVSAVPEKSRALIRKINAGILGKSHAFTTPFGERKVLYCDWTASGKSLDFIEDYIKDEVLPFYGNTHTTTSITGLQSTCFRHEARQIIAQAVNAKITGRAAEDVVLFTGGGTTAAINKLVDVLGLRRTGASIPQETQRPVVFVGPYEHHSNLLPWRESIAEVVTIPEDNSGKVDVVVLEEQLTRYSDRPLKIGSFSAASNLTGQLTDTEEISFLLHKHGALSFWDYASAAPYVRMDMNPVNCSEPERRPFIYKDAIFFSCHKFVGGPGSSGILVIKKRLLSNAVPSAVGGGTVFYVTDKDHRYLSNREEREEGGTPDIVGSIRAGLVMHLRESVGTSVIHSLEKQTTSKVMTSLRANPNIVLLGSTENERLPIFSFLIKFSDGNKQKFLHYNYVCALLNDLFGIQTRGGCQCAGPYGQRLLGIDFATNIKFEKALIEEFEVVRPGFTRFSLPYFMSEEEQNYVLGAIHLIADHGWKLLPLYRFHYKTGEWKHHTRMSKFPERKWLSRASIFKGTEGVSKGMSQEAERSGDAMTSWMDQYIREATAKLTGMSHSDIVSMIPKADQSRMLPEQYSELAWFAFPSDALALLKDQKSGRSPQKESIRDGTVAIKPLDYTKLALRGTEVHGTVETYLSVPLASSGTADNSPAAEAFSSKSGMNAKASAQSSDSEEEDLPANAAACCPIRKRPTGAEADNLSERQESSKYPLRDNTGSEGIRGLSELAKILALPEKVKRNKLFPNIPVKIKRNVGLAVMQWDMIQEGDRLLLGLSGGKDSLTLLHALYQLQKRAPVKFHLAAATVDPCTPSFDPSPLKGYMEALGIPYYYLKEPIIERAETEMQNDSLCSYCSRMKRGLLYACCRREGFNKLVLAQHLDDLVESMFMSAMHNGQLRTMKANYLNDTGDIRIIRPLIYTREHETKKFALEAALPVINENCPACFEQPKERHRIKKMLAKQETVFPDMFTVMRRALVPLMDSSVYPLMSEISTRVANKSYQKKRRFPDSGEQQTKNGGKSSEASGKASEPMEVEGEKGSLPAKKSRASASS